MILSALIFLLCLGLSAFFSGSEMSFVSTNKLKMRELADRGNRAAQKILLLQDQPQYFLTMILIGNNIVNVTATAIFTSFLEMQYGIKNVWVATALLAPLIIVWGEMVPKDYGRLRSQAWLVHCAYVLYGLVNVLKIPVILILKTVDFFLKPFGGVSMNEKNIFVSEKEFRLLIDEGAKSGALGVHEKQLIDVVLDFGKEHAEAVMIPLEKCPKVAITSTVSEVKELAKKTKAKMFLVYEELPTLIVGMVYVFDLLFEVEGNKSLKGYLRSPLFLSYHESVERAFLALQEKRQSYAVVVDLAGEVAGVVAIEKLLTS